MKNTLETRLGIFVALALIAAVLILEMVGGVEIFRSGYRLNAEFNTIQDLKEGDRVKMAGVEIGRVEHIDLTNNKVRVTMKIRKERIVRTDSTATVLNSSPVNVTVTRELIATTFIPSGSTWKYLDNGSDQGTNWSQLSYIDSSWQSWKRTSSASRRMRTNER